MESGWLWIHVLYCVLSTLYSLPVALSTPFPLSLSCYHLDSRRRVGRQVREASHCQLEGGISLIHQRLRQVPAEIDQHGCACLSEEELTIGRCLSLTSHHFSSPRLSLPATLFFLVETVLERCLGTHLTILSST
ncbi:hypothetical protein XA68_11938 [Ophiocordyceps unilateralis]|uniref:Uncharacterized protein n=1 Tax=Ophiocordyceps unilateralis TaxID=268505 RepID=A0A2A9PEH4_OPHUN|nr:hypothetical protein XA68_11938 [Ophiocordyceps unilateralis]